MLPQGVLDQFARIPHDTPIKNKYYGVYNKILSRVCFADDAFTILPQCPPPQTAGLPTIDFVITYVVQVNDLPIFFLEFNLPLYLARISSRVDADAQMKARFRALYNLFSGFMASVSWDKDLLQNYGSCGSQPRLRRPTNTS